jgi:hypothetical protein
MLFNFSDDLISEKNSFMNMDKSNRVVDEI